MAALHMLSLQGDGRKKFAHRDEHVAHDAVCAQADFFYLLQVDVHIASTCAAAGSHSQKGKSRVPGQLRGRTAAFRGLDAVVKIHRHVPPPLPCASYRHHSMAEGWRPVLDKFNHRVLPGFSSYLS